MNRWIKIILAISDLASFLLFLTAAQGWIWESGPEADLLHAQMAWIATLVAVFAWTWLALYPWLLMRHLQPASVLSGFRSAEDAPYRKIRILSGTALGIVLSFFTFSSMTYSLSLSRRLHGALAVVVISILLVVRLVVTRSLLQLANPKVFARL
jgi:hypothetical protein